jgi:hypothetical protein
VASTFRQVWRWLLPRNIAKPDDLADEGALVAHTLTTIIDLTLTRAREGLNARFPSRAGASANALTASDRGLPQGRAETAAEHATRLKAWRTPRTHRVRGNAYELLAQIAAYWGAGTVVATYANGVEHVRAANGALSKNAAPSFNWDTSDPDYDPARWARFWLELDAASIGAAEQPDFGDPALWGGALGTPGYTLGQTGVTPADVLAMRNLFQQGAWHPEHAQPEWLVLSFNADVGGGNINMGGASNRWSYYDAGTETQRSSRDSLYRYWSLDPGYNNRYSGNPASFAAYATRVDNTGVYGPGDPENAAAWGAISMPRGGTYYAGNAESFPINVLLLDDGSIPV